MWSTLFGGSKPTAPAKPESEASGSSASATEPSLAELSRTPEGTKHAADEAASSEEKTASSEEKAAPSEGGAASIETPYASEAASETAEPTVKPAAPTPGS